MFRKLASTTLRAFVGAAFAVMPRVPISEAVAPVSRAVEKVRLFIIMILSLHRKGRVASFSLSGAGAAL
jgi:hypothetical protein